MRKNDADGLGAQFDGAFGDAAIAQTRAAITRSVSSLKATQEVIARSHRTLNGSLKRLDALASDRLGTDDPQTV